jgi:hypothetical protein
MDSHLWLWWFPTHSPQKGEWMGHGNILLLSAKITGRIEKPATGS